MGKNGRKPKNPPEEYRDPSKPWLISNPALPDDLNQARWEVFSLNGATLVIWVLAFFIADSLRWYWILGLLSTLVAFFLLYRHDNNIRLMYRKYHDSPVPCISHVMMLNAIGFVYFGSPSASQSGTNGGVLPVILTGSCLTLLFWLSIRRSKYAWEDVAFIIFFLFVQGYKLGPAIYQTF